MNITCEKLGGPHRRLVQSSNSADTGCFPDKSLHPVRVMRLPLPLLFIASS